MDRMGRIRLLEQGLRDADKWYQSNKPKILANQCIDRQKKWRGIA